jgi:murein DD-endopeptidase MepM/ murein hydrolase activator NlpD
MDDIAGPSPNRKNRCSFTLARTADNVAMRLSRRLFLQLAGAIGAAPAFPNLALACSGRRVAAAALGEVADPTFSWPVRGQVVQDFCSNTLGNPGISIAAPEGTLVKAAADGVVAYAGRDLKGYGGLILLRHRNGWVTAYAFNRELLVERGDQVRQGQSIARVGHTAEMGPALHFEIRRMTEPVDPTDYLPNR